MLANPVEQGADPRIGLPTGGLGDLGHLVEQLLLASEQGRGGRVGRRPERGRGGGLDLGVFFCLQLLLRERGPVVVAADRRREQVEGTGAQRCLGGGLRCFPLPLHGPAVDAQRAGEGFDGREQPLLQAGEQAGRRRPACASSRAGAVLRAGARYSSSSADSCSSGASAGRPSMSICDDGACGETALDNSRRSSLSRRTMTSSTVFRRRRARRGRTAAGSRISSRAEKLLEWPLCGVADRNSRCSNRGARSRMARVICESMAYVWPLAGAAWWASSRMKQRAAAEGRPASRAAARRRPRRSAADARPGSGSAWSTG